MAESHESEIVARSAKFMMQSGVTTMRVVGFVIGTALICVFTSAPSIAQQTTETASPQAVSPGASSSPAASGSAASEASKTDSKEDSSGKTAEGEWRPLLPKSGLEGWEKTDFGTDSSVSRDGDLLVIEMGDPLNGITYKKGDFPTDNFEIQLEAKRVEGNDFLCGLTFPVGKDDQFCSLIAGGWGGSVVGLSSIDGVDASENGTTSYVEFENGKWYKFRVRVDPKQITVWIDDKRLFFHEREGHEFSTRIEVWNSQPLGFCTFLSKVHVRNFGWRPVKLDGADDSSKTEEPQISEAIK